MVVGWIKTLLMAIKMKVQISLLIDLIIVIKISYVKNVIKDHHIGMAKK
jgi:hypothetical protein